MSKPIIEATGWRAPVAPFAYWPRALRWGVLLLWLAALSGLAWINLGHATPLPTLQLTPAQPADFT